MEPVAQTPAPSAQLIALAHDKIEGPQDGTLSGTVGSNERRKGSQVYLGQFQ